MAGETTTPEQMHLCQGVLPYVGEGEVIRFCAGDDERKLWAGASRRETQVAYCPYCGFRAGLPPEVKPAF